MANQNASSTDKHVVDMFAVARIAQDVAARPFSYPGSIKLVAPAKVNLYLDIGQKRPDGYHEAISIMHALALHDTLHMRLMPSDEEGLSIRLTSRSCEGLPSLDVAPQDNIVSKAVRLLASRIDRTCNETMLISIDKHIPFQAGLGGGSSDAAAALLGASRLWGLGSDDARIEEVARVIGADTAFFLHGGCACFTGVGDEFEHVLEPMKSFVVLVKPEGGVSTAEAYRAFDCNPISISLEERARALQASCAKNVPLKNNLSTASESVQPILSTIRTWVSEQEGVEGALMSGSGSATFACCDSFATASRIATEAKLKGWWARATTCSPAGAAVVSAR